MTDVILSNNKYKNGMNIKIERIKFVECADKDIVSEGDWIVGNQMELLLIEDGYDVFPYGSLYFYLNEINYKEIKERTQLNFSNLDEYLKNKYDEKDWIIDSIKNYFVNAEWETPEG